MESGRSDLARRAVEVSAAAAADPDLEASAGAGKGKFVRPQDAVTVTVTVTVTETTCAWTGQKKTKIQSTPTSGDHSSGKIVRGQGQDRGWFRFLKWNRGGNRLEEIDGLDWDDDKLEKEVDACLRQLKDNPFVYLGGAIDDEALTILDEQEQRELDRRLALCRLRAHWEKYHDIDDQELSVLFPYNDLDDYGYFVDWEGSFEWYFDRAYCQYADFQDYQRLVVRNINDCEYEDWEFYRSTCSTLEGDQDYVQFWEKLSSTTQLIDWHIKSSTCEQRNEKLFYYHTLKIAAEHPNVYKTLVNSGFYEFIRRLRITFISSLGCADFYFEM
jgi:hypothetical protein